jgi:hypothetical protein
VHQQAKYRQRLSEAIKSNPMQSYAILCNQIQSHAIICNQRPFEAIRGHSRRTSKSSTIRGNQWQSRVIKEAHQQVEYQLLRRLAFTPRPLCIHSRGG